MNIQDVSWEELSCYEFDCYPDNLIVTTNADEAAFEAAKATFYQKHNLGDMVTIEEVLRGAGFVAVCGCRKWVN